jgi:hypothetical protein
VLLMEMTLVQQQSAIGRHIQRSPVAKRADIASDPSRLVCIKALRRSRPAAERVGSRPTLLAA